MSLHQSESGAPLRVAVVGYGYWGPNLVRNVAERPEWDLAGLCEMDPERGAAFSARMPGYPVWSDLDDVVADDTIDAVLVATPPRTHHAIAHAALSAGKHVLVEKPLAKTAAEALDLVELARANELVLMPGHTFLYSPPVNKIRDLIKSDQLGEVYFVTSSRMNLGKYQSDGVICDLAPHDLSILLYLLEQPVVSIAASARSVFQEGVPEVAFLTLTFANGTTANVQISWLAPRKVREMVVVGSQKMVQYDDTAADESVRVFDRGMDFKTPENFGEHQLSYRSGDIVIPRVDAAEPLGLELADFAHAIRTGERPRSHAELGYEIVAAVEAAEESLRNGGAPVAVTPMVTAI
ncbi:MAG TPA: Gfo/Idh/MocA family oxidoreductase [Baekduia sp.]|nr:Gfo/Idh/MocA family oxidoreductase [Baekduia sp.]